MRSLGGGREDRVLTDAADAIEREDWIEPEFDPDAVRQLKASSTADISISGADLAGQALDAGLVDECHLFVFPIVIGGGKRTLPDNVRVRPNCSTSAASAMASFTCTTRPR